MSEHSCCQKMLGTLSDYIDGTLQEELCAELELHLNGCVNCRVVVNTLRKTVELVHDSGAEVELPKGVGERLFTRLNLAPTEPVDQT